MLDRRRCDCCRSRSAVAVGVGVASDWEEPGLTEIGEPVLKKPTVAFVGLGAWSASNRKLYNVPKRIALAFWLVANVSVLQVIELASWVTSQACCYIRRLPGYHHAQSRDAAAARETRCY